MAPHLHPAAPWNHLHTLMDFPVAPGSALLVNFGLTGARLAMVSVGKGVAKSQTNLGSNPAHTTY